MAHISANQPLQFHCPPRFHRGFTTLGKRAIREVVGGTAESCVFQRLK